MLIPKANSSVSPEIWVKRQAVLVATHPPPFFQRNYLLREMKSMAFSWYSGRPPDCPCLQVSRHQPRLTGSKTKFIVFPVIIFSIFTW